MLLVIYIFYYIHLLYIILYLYILLCLYIFHVPANTLDSQSRTWRSVRRFTTLLDDSDIHTYMKVVHK